MSKGADKFVHEPLHEILMESLIQSSPNANIYRRRATNPFSPRQATVSLHPWSNVPPRFLLRRLGKLLLSLLSGRYRTISRRSRSPFRFHLSINSSGGWRARFLFEISAVIRVLCIRDELRRWGEERKARRKEESFAENTVLPGEHSNSLPGSRSFRFTRGHHGRGVVSPAITPTVILLYFAAHLFCPPPCSQTRRIFYARYLRGSLAKCGTIAPRGIVSFVSFEKTLPRVKPPPRLNIYEFSIKEQSLDRREATSCLIIPELKIRN